MANQLSNSIAIDSNPISHHGYFATFIGKLDNRQKIVKIFDQAKMEQLGLTDTIEFNLAVFSDLTEYVYSRHFLQVEQKRVNKSLYLIEPYYMHRLD